ncbi:MAG: PqiC family protein [Kiritimatiellia bacterium]|jgi:uncharacterized lipoprotein YmbA
MKNIYTKSLLLLIAVSIAGCMHSPIPRLYLLHSKRGDADTAADSSSHKGLIILRPVVMAEYLNRPQIILRKGEREVMHAEFDRWAEPLKTQAHNYLVEALASALPEYNIKSLIRGDKTKHLFEIVVVIHTLDGTPGESVCLRANWQIFSAAEELRSFAEGKSDLSAICSEPGISGMVAATEAVLNQLSREIAIAFAQHHAPDNAAHENQMGG